MKAVVFHGPFDIAVEDRPVPRILDPTDVVVKVLYTAVCGSDLHVYRVSAHYKPKSSNLSCLEMEIKLTRFRVVEI